LKIVYNSDSESEKNKEERQLVAVREKIIRTMKRRESDRK
jgi:hypothetical protein